MKSVSINRIVEIKCNGVGPTPCPDSAGISDYLNAAGMRARLREWGWATGLPGGLDRCPKCRANAEEARGARR